MITVKDLILIAIAMISSLMFYLSGQYYYVILILLVVITVLVLKFARGYFYYKRALVLQRNSFIKFLNHDLKVSTLAQIRGLEFLLKNPNLENYDLISDVFDSCKYTFDMITTLINNYRIEAGDEVFYAEVLKPSELLNISCERVTSLLEQKNIKLKNYLNSNDLLLVDRLALIKVLDILLSLAFEFASKNSIMVILTRKKADCVEFNIGFTGDLLGKSEIENLFTDTYQFSTVGQSIKIQLCKKIIESHGGTISVSSKENNISYFTFAIPVAKNIVVSEMVHNPVLL